VLRLQRDQATHFLSRIPQPGRDYGRFVAFNHQPFLDAQGTDPQELAKALNKEGAHGGTALYDALVACSDQLSKDSSVALRLMVILSDGEDNSSHVSRDATVLILVKAGVRVYSIGRGEAPRAVAALKQFAEATGGKNYFPRKEEDLDKILRDISGDLDSLFSVIVAPANILPGDCTYKIELKFNKKNISISAPRQYFAPLQ
jgi:Ca-activated chloride channel family protein